MDIFAVGMGLIVVIGMGLESIAKAIAQDRRSQGRAGSMKYCACCQEASRRAPGGGGAEGAGIGIDSAEQIRSLNIAAALLNAAQPTTAGRTDGERLDWLATHTEAKIEAPWGMDHQHWTITADDGYYGEGATLRAAIDAAMEPTVKGATPEDREYLAAGESPRPPADPSSAS